MTKNKELLIFLTIAIITYIFIEVFVNFVLYVNAVIFLSWKDLTMVLFWIIIYLVVLFGEILAFAKEKIDDNLKTYVLLIIICGFRIVTQFFFIIELYLLCLTILFVSLLLLFTEILSLYKKLEYFQDYQLLIGGIILGISIHFSLLVFNVSSNLLVEIIKIPITIIFVILLLYINQIHFKPDILKNDLKSINRKDTDLKETELKLSHYFLFGIIFFLCISWFFNPMGLSAYDVAILDWYEYGFLYYNIIIVSSMLLSFFFVRFIFLNLESIMIKKVLLIVNSLFCLINCLALFIIDVDFSIISTIYITSLAIISVFTIIFNLSYIFQTKTLPETNKRYAGIIVFFLSFVFAFAFAIIFTWTLYSSLLITILILSAIFSGIWIFKEIKKIETLNIYRENIINRNKLFGLIFVLMFGANLLCVSYVLSQRSYEEGTDDHPTIMVWNIHNGIGLDGKFDLDRLIGEIKEYDPDVVGLNEVDLGVLKTSFVDIAAYFAEKLDMYYYYGPTFFKHYGNAILSKYPFKEIETINLPVDESVLSEPRGVIRAKVDIDGKEWTFYVNHLATNELHRLKQIPFIVKLIDEETFQRVVWMGDFNCNPDSKPYAKINSTRDIKFTDTHGYLGDPKDTGGLDPNANPSNRIDFILCSPDLIPTKAEVHCSVASDHCAVITEF